MSITWPEIVGAVVMLSLIARQYQLIRELEHRLDLTIVHANNEFEKIVSFINDEDFEIDQGEEV